MSLPSALPGTFLPHVAEVSIRSTEVCRAHKIVVGVESPVGDDVNEIVRKLLHYSEKTFQGEYCVARHFVDTSSLLVGKPIEPGY